MSRTTRSRAVAVLLGLLVLAGSACTPAPDGEQGVRDVRQQRGPAGTVPSGLDTFYGQSLSWSDCAPYARSDLSRQLFPNDTLQCARAEVPLDYDDPDGATATIGLLRRPAAEPKQRIGSLLINPGGPGVSGMQAAASIAPGLANSDLGRRFDLVGFDPRGIGASEPSISCYTGKERDELRADTSGLGADPAAVRAAEREQREFAEKCTERTGEEFLATVGTADVVKDMDVLRSALGDAKLSYVGYSYGTRIGTAYGEEFPRNVRAMVLDGAVDADQDQAESVVRQAEGFQQAFDDFAAWCAKREDCPLGADPAQAVRQYQQLVRPLIERPAELPNGRVLSYDDATIGTIQALYSQQFWQALGTGLTRLRENDGSLLMMLADLYNERNRDGSYANTQDASQAIRCVDDPPVRDKALLRSVEQRFQQAAPFLSAGVPAAGALDSCAFWPVPNTSRPHEPQVDGLPTTVVISTTGDPSTPYQAGVQLAESLRARLLTFQGTQHTVFLQGNRCVDEAGTRYLVQGTLPQQGKRC